MANSVTTTETKKTASPSSGEKKPFDWTPILLIVVALLSVAIGFLLFMKR
jgi:hypothetical protein